MSLDRMDPRQLRPADENPRRISDDALARLRYSLEQDPGMMEARPLIVDADKGDVVCGNMRLRVILELGWDTVPVYVKKFRDDAERREWLLRDNQGYGEWVPDELAGLLRLHEQDGGDMALTGFTDAEYHALLAGIDNDAPPAGGEDTNPDAAPEPPAEPRTKPGDVWLLGRHRVMCGDALNGDQLAHLYGPTVEHVAAVIADPPYGIDLDTDYSTMKGIGRGRTYDRVTGDAGPFDPGVTVHFFDDVPEQFWFGADYYRHSLPWLPTEGSWLVWDKRSETSDEGFGSAFELIASSVRHQRLILRHLWFGMFGDDAHEARNRLHPTQKPVALIEDILDRWVDPDGTVADPFAGSGSTLIACERTGRACFAMELEPAYVDVIVDRWENQTGQEATLWKPSDEPDPLRYVL